MEGRKREKERGGESEVRSGAEEEEGEEEQREKEIVRVGDVVWTLRSMNPSTLPVLML